MRLAYQEKDYRRALLGYHQEFGEDDFVDPDIREDIRKAAEGMTDGCILRSLTSSSRNSFFDYSTISASRMMQESYLAAEESGRTAVRKDYYQLAEFLVQKMDEMYWTDVKEEEILGLYDFLTGCKTISIQDVPEEMTIHGNTLNLRDLIYKMSYAYDAAYALRMNEDEVFLQGMIAHLRPTIVRLIQREPIENPLLPEEQKQYGDVMRRAKKAAGVLAETIGIAVPEEEVGLLGFHLGAAIYRIETRQRRRRVVRIGVVCMEGIGISVLMASKIRHHFGDKVETYTIREGDLSEANVDFYVSSFETEIPGECIQVDPMLKEEELRNIEKIVEKYAFQERKEKGTSGDERSMVELRTSVSSVKDVRSENQIYEAERCVVESAALLRSFHIMTLDDAVTFEEAVKQISDRLASSADSSSCIYRRFMEREAKSTQVLPEQGIVFLHARSGEMIHPMFILARAENGEFRNTYFGGCGTIVVILIPEDLEQDNSVIPQISVRIFEEEDVLELIKCGTEQDVRERLAGILEGYIRTYMGNLFFIK